MDLLLFCYQNRIQVTTITTHIRSQFAQASSASLRLSCFVLKRLAYWYRTQLCVVTDGAFEERREEFEKLEVGEECESRGVDGGFERHHAIEAAWEAEADRRAAVHAPW